MARDSDRESPEAFPALPNILLILVLGLLLIWGIGGLYLPEATGSQGSVNGVRTADTVAPPAPGDAALPISD